MKKYSSVFITILLIIGAMCFTACGKKEENSMKSSKTSGASSAADEKLKIVTTIFPEYDWVKEILGENAENAEITMLLDDGVDLHSYQPTMEDILKISTCDLFVYVGGESDQWVDDALAEATNPNMKVINLLDQLGDSVKEEEVIEGMEEEKETGEEEEPEYDEHVWLSLKNAKILCESIAEVLEKIDPDHAKLYQSNADQYTKKLDELDWEYQAVVDSAAQKTVLFGDRFPFRYMVDDYGLSYYAAFVGCSAETEASFETIAFLSQKMDELQLKNIFTNEKSDQKIAKAILGNTKDKEQQILMLDSMQSTTSEDVSNGTTYISVMENNLNVLKEALK